MKPIVPREWADLFIAVVEFAKACGGSFHVSDPAKAAAMAMVIDRAADLVEDGNNVVDSGRDLAAQFRVGEAPT
jgi:hypothetical protein